MGIALEFAKAGYDVAVHHSPRSEKSAKELCERMEALGARTLAVGGDLRREESIDRVFRRVEDEFGELDAFVNNAGVTIGDTLLDALADDWDDVFLINVRAALLCLQKAGRMMVRRGTKGHMVVILSNQMDWTGMGTGIYASSKAALRKVVEAAAVEFMPFGIHVNGIAPGCVDTGAERMGKNERSFDRIPAHRWVTLEEMGQMALFLCGPWAQSMVGHILLADGGANLCHDMDRLDAYAERMRERIAGAGGGAEPFGREAEERERAGRASAGREK